MRINSTGDFLNIICNKSRCGIKDKWKLSVQRYHHQYLRVVLTISSWHLEWFQNVCLGYTAGRNGASRAKTINAVSAVFAHIIWSDCSAIRSVRSNLCYFTELIQAHRVLFCECHFMNACSGKFSLLTIMILVKCSDGSQYCLWSGSQSTLVRDCGVFVVS